MIIGNAVVTRREVVIIEGTRASKERLLLKPDASLALVRAMIEKQNGLFILAGSKERVLVVQVFEDEKLVATIDVRN